MPVPKRGGRLGCVGCVGRIAVVLVLGALAVLLIDAVFAPWAFFLGGGFHALPYWQGLGRFHPPAGDDYVVFVRMWPTPGGRGYPSVTGTAELCTPRGERFPLRLGGSFLDKRRWQVDSDQRRMSLYLHTRPALSFLGGAEHRPRFELHGAWRNPDLVMDDHGTLSRAFLPDGRAYLGPARDQPAARGIAAVTLHAGGHADFEAACRATGGDQRLPAEERRR